MLYQINVIIGIKKGVITRYGPRFLMGLSANFQHPCFELRHVNKGVSFQLQVALAPPVLLEFLFSFNLFSF